MTDTIQKRGLDSEGNYKFLPYDAKAPIVEKGFRTIKVMYKTPKSGEEKKDNSCLLVTPISVDDIENNLDSLMPYIVNMVESVQDKIGKDLHSLGETSVSPSALSMEAVIERLQTDAIGGRLNKETIDSWFTSTLADTMTVLFADKLGISDTPTEADAERIDRFVKVYRSKLTGLASNLTVYPVEEVEKLLSALDKCEIDSTDTVGNRVKERLVKMKTPVNVVEFLDL